MVVGLLASLFMPSVSVSHVNEVTKKLNQITTNVMAELSTSAKATIGQGNTFQLIGSTGIKLGDITQSNEAKIDVSAVSNAAANGDLQKKLIEEVNNQIKQEAKSQNSISINTTNMETDIKDIITQNITTKSVSEAFAGVSQSNLIEIVNSKDSSAGNITQTNVGQAIAKLTASSATKIAAALETEFKKQTSVDQKSISETKFPNLFGGPALMLIVLLVVVGGGLFFAKTFLPNFDDLFGAYKQPIMIGIGLLVALIFGLIIYNIVSPKK
jgi:hypothetical protein